MELDILQFVPQNIMILIPAIYILGIFLRNSPKIKNWTIPWILMVLGILGSIVIEGFSFLAIIQGIIVAGMAVFTNQIVKQTRNKD
ncbi:phage holin family protein [Clostridium fallax]|uniref:Phage holin family Hol44, holin superfamily V n=1 Tax=Clostridium fallax TaxID=1533 RepID=A0A1M4WCB2_9CLOT|nr:phage holin family protein [Clostridium fallax]SHE78703.1 Phage holin family Hol44, holin superfamily V [Clostridium fallax]SQB05905.1 phage holin [Clostridium fallax]